jgi:hypothetical protein
VLIVVSGVPPFLAVDAMVFSSSPSAVPNIPNRQKLRRRAPVPGWRVRAAGLASSRSASRSAHPGGARDVAEERPSIVAMRARSPPRARRPDPPTIFCVFLPATLPDSRVNVCCGSRTVAAHRARSRWHLRGFSGSTPTDAAHRRRHHPRSARRYGQVDVIASGVHLLDTHGSGRLPNRSALVAAGRRTGAAAALDTRILPM